MTTATAPAQNIDVLIEQLLDAQPQQRCIPVSWTQGRTCYGGLSAALCLRAMRRRMGEQEAARPLRNLFVSFAGPLFADLPFELEVIPLRTGKTVGQLQAVIRQQDRICVTVQAIFGFSLESQVQVEDFTPPNLPGIEQSRDFPFIDKVTPAFLQQVELKLAVGDYPGMGSDSRELGGWMRFQEPAETYNEINLTGLIDAWPPATLQMARGVRSASTVSWHIRFVQPLASVSGSEYLGYLANITHSRDGFGYTDAGIWAPDGRLLALSSQTVLVFS